LADGSRPVIAQVGDPTIGFVSGLGAIYHDSLLPGQQNGSFFLVDDTIRNNRPLDLLVSFSNPVSYVSAEIFDIEFRPSDGTEERWMIEIYDNNNNVLDSQMLDRMTPGTGDGLATPFSFSRGFTDIGGMRISYQGDATGGPGFGFDNFYAGVEPIPEPSSVLILLGCVPGYLVRRRAMRSVQN
jgi:hypothetical protein